MEQFFSNTGLTSTSANYICNVAKEHLETLHEKIRAFKPYDTDMWAEKGPWKIDKDSYPKDFPEEYKEKLLEVINEELPWGCCGGCI